MKPDTIYYLDGSGKTVDYSPKEEPMEYQIGDRIRNTAEGSSRNKNLWKKGTIYNKAWNGSEGYGYYIRYDDGESGFGHINDYRLLDATELASEDNKKPFMSKVSIMMKKLLDGDTQKLVKAGFINGDLMLTCEGTEALNAVLFSEHKEALVKLAEEKIAEEGKKN